MAYVEYIAETDEQKKSRAVFREKDLNHHISNLDEDDDKAPSGDADGEMKQMLREDNQLKSAFNILKSLALYVSYKQSE